MGTTAALNLLLFLIFVGLVVAVFARPPDETPNASSARRAASFLIGFVSGPPCYLLTGLDSWEDFHLSVFVALAVTFAASVLIARSGGPVRYWPLALSGYVGILSLPVVGYTLLLIICVGGCSMS